MKRYTKKCRASKVAEDELGRIVVFYEFCEVYFFFGLHMKVGPLGFSSFGEGGK